MEAAANNVEQAVAAPAAPAPAPRPAVTPPKPAAVRQPSGLPAGISLVPQQAPVRTSEHAPVARKPTPPPAPPGAAKPAVTLPQPVVPPALRKPTVLSPSQVAHAPLESAAFRMTVELERAVDAQIERRRTEIRESLRVGDTPAKATRVLRLYVWNTVQQPSAPGEQHAWTLHVHAKLLEPPANSTAAQQAAANAPLAAAAGMPPPRFCSLLRRLEVRLDEAHFPAEAGALVWEREAALGATTAAAAAAGLPPAADGFEVKRLAARCPLTGAPLDTHVSVQVELQHTPERYTVPPKLMKALGLPSTAMHGGWNSVSRPAVLFSLWAWAKTNNCLTSDDASQTTLTSVQWAQLGLPPPPQPAPLAFSHLASSVLQELRPVPPLSIPYTIRAGMPAPPPPGSAPALVAAAASGRHPAVAFDCHLELPDAHSTLGSLALEWDSEVLQLEAEIAKQETVAQHIVAQIAERRSRHAFLTGFATSPADFVNALVAGQARDLELVGGGEVRARAAEQRAAFYQQPWVEDAVSAYLQRPGEGAQPAAVVLGK